MATNINTDIELMNSLNLVTLFKIFAEIGKDQFIKLLFLNKIR